MRHDPKKKVQDFITKTLLSTKAVYITAKVITIKFPF